MAAAARFGPWHIESSSPAGRTAAKTTLHATASIMNGHSSRGRRGLMAAATAMNGSMSSPS
jgi:hypothetical protein